MASIQSLLNLKEFGMFMASIDLKDAFFSVPIYEDPLKLLTSLSKASINLSACQMGVTLQCVFLQKSQKYHSHT